MKRKLFSLLLILALTLGLTAGAWAASPWEEVFSGEELAQALAPRAQVFSLAAAEEPVRVLLLADSLQDDCGAVRVIHWAALRQFVLEYPDAAEAEAAWKTLSGIYGRDVCWLDTAENGATVLAPADGEPEVSPAPTAEPTPEPSPDATAEPTPEPTTNPTPAPTAQPDSPRTPRSWGAAAMGLDTFLNDRAVRAHSAQQKVTIAMLDTGADLRIPALSGRNFSADSYDFVNATKAITDVTGSGPAAGHGTMVTSLLDDLLPENVDLMLLRVFDNHGSASPTMVRTAFAYALEHGADIINMSLGWEGGDGTQHYLDDLLDQAYAAGVPVVCAAGNASADVKTCYPACYRTTVAVSAIDKEQRYELFSNYGSGVDFCAPGSTIRTFGLHGVAMLSRGTSFAAPHITAAMADMLLLSPDAKPAELYAALKSGALDLGDEGKDQLYGWGLPQLMPFAESHLKHDWSDWVIDPIAKRDTDGARKSACTVCGEERTEAIPATKDSTKNPFRDVAAQSWFAPAVTWASVNEITSGTSETVFSPDASCTRAQMVTFLWRAAGRPEPETTRSPFSDVRSPSDYYYKAVLWAVEQEITNGTSSTTFSPQDTVTRAQTVTFLWRLAGKPTAAAENPFEDVGAVAYYRGAVLWAVQREITNGVDATRFAPESPCTRAQIVTFLYRDLGV